MKHNDFTKRVKKLFARKKTNPVAAARGLRELAQDCEAASKQSISLWHIEQAYGLASTVFEVAGRKKEAMAAEHKVVEIHRAELKYHGHGLAHSLGVLALACFSSGKTEDGVKFAYESLRYFGQYPSPSYLIEKLGLELKKHGRPGA